MAATQGSGIFQIRRKWSIRFGWLALLTLAFSVAVAAPAQASGLETYMDLSTSRCLQGVAQTFDQTRVNTIPSCDGTGTNGSIYWTPVAFGSYREIRSAANGYCLDSNAGHQVYKNPCGNGGNDYQLWRILSAPRGSIQFQDKATGLCLDSNAAGAAYTNVCDYNNFFQDWI